MPIIMFGQKEAGSNFNITLPAVKYFGRRVIAVRFYLWVMRAYKERKLALLTTR